MKEQPSWKLYLKVNLDILNHNDTNINRIALFGDPSRNDFTNILILDGPIEFLLASKKFDGPLI